MDGLKLRQKIMKTVSSTVDADLAATAFLQEKLRAATADFRDDSSSPDDDDEESEESGRKSDEIDEMSDEDESLSIQDLISKLKTKNDEADIKHATALLTELTPPAA